MVSEKLAKKLTPSFVRKILRKRRDRKVQAEFAGLSNQQVFEKIYEERRWGAPPDGTRKYSSGDGTREREIVAAYVDAVSRFVSDKKHIRTALDLGCGDFTVGAQLAGRFERYIAADVAANLIRENKRLFKDKRVRFVRIDLTRDELPRCDIIFVRQVLQHLSNAEIRKFVANVQGRFKFLVVTESVSKSMFFTANKDITTGPGIRIHDRSGVVLESAPFNLKFTRVETILKKSKGQELFVTKVYSN